MEFGRSQGLELTKTPTRASAAQLVTPPKP